MTDKTLPQRMREAAKVLSEAQWRLDPETTPIWSPFKLNQFADEWEAEDARHAAQEAEAEELARCLHDPFVGPLKAEWSFLDAAKSLLAAGWRKVADDE